MKEIIEDFRCACGKLLFRGFLLSASVQIKCRECKQILYVEGQRSIASSDRYILACDREGYIVKSSSSASQILGIPAETLHAKRLNDVVLMLSTEFFEELWDMAESEGSPVSFDTLQRNGDKSYVPVRLEVATKKVDGVENLMLHVERKRSKHLALRPGGRILRSRLES